MPSAFNSTLSSVRCRIETHFTTNQIGKNHFFSRIGYFDADYIRNTFVQQPLRFIGRHCQRVAHVTTGSRTVLRRGVFGFVLVAHGFQFFRRIKSVISMPVVHQLFCIQPVRGFSFALAVRGKVAALQYDSRRAVNRTRQAFQKCILPRRVQSGFGRCLLSAAQTCRHAGGQRSS